MKITKRLVKIKSKTTTESDSFDSDRNDVRAKLAGLKKKKAAKKNKKHGIQIGREAEFMKRYKHFVPGSLGFDPAKAKATATIKCVDCGGKRSIFTSDLFQVERCLPCLKEKRKKVRSNK